MMPTCLHGVMGSQPCAACVSAPPEVTEHCTYCEDGWVVGTPQHRIRCPKCRGTTRRTRPASSPESAVALDCDEDDALETARASAAKRIAELEAALTSVSDAMGAELTREKAAHAVATSRADLNYAAAEEWKRRCEEEKAAHLATQKERDELKRDAQSIATYWTERLAEEEARSANYRAEREEARDDAQQAKEAQNALRERLATAERERDSIQHERNAERQLTIRAQDEAAALRAQVETLTRENLDLRDFAGRHATEEERLVAAERQVETLTKEIEAQLSATPGAVRVREGGGPEDLAASLAVTMAKLRASKPGGRVGDLTRKLNAAESLLAQQPAPKPEADRFACGPCQAIGVAVDEDGCCATCGADAVPVDASGRVAFAEPAPKQTDVAKHRPNFRKRRGQP